MNALARGLLVGLLQVTLVAVLGGKLLVERSSLPRVWASVAPYDPELPIRGRYVSLRVKVQLRGFEDPVDESSWHWATLSVEKDQLIATKAEPNVGHQIAVRRNEQGLLAMLDDPVAFFIPEHAEDPSSRPGLMVEVTVPGKGPPRPIRLGLREGDEIQPLDL